MTTIFISHQSLYVNSDSIQLLSTTFDANRTTGTTRSVTTESTQRTTSRARPAITESTRSTTTSTARPVTTESTRSTTTSTTRSSTVESTRSTTTSTTRSSTAETTRPMTTMGRTVTTTSVGSTRVTTMTPSIVTTVTTQLIRTTTNITGTVTPSVSEFNTFQRQALTEMNLYRTYHCAQNVILNATLNSIAQNYSEELAATNTFVHSGNGYGENLWMTMSSGVINITRINGSTPVNDWYAEVSAYNWTSPGFTSSTGHFTQVVWNATRQFGIGIACNRNSTSCYVTANYWPPGNYGGQFPTNVKKGPPPCS
ncbi:unnamed protein product [Rotaria magnacalcarata]|nr:unnamed protein product [Rotaria magnacalcarata]